MPRALLDINVVIALLDQGHVLHRPASRWLEQQLEHGWATCPLIENGVVRIMPSRPSRTRSPPPWWYADWRRPSSIPAMRSGLSRSARCRRV